MIHDKKKIAQITSCRYGYELRLRLDNIYVEKL